MGEGSPEKITEGPLKRYFGMRQILGDEILILTTPLVQSQLVFE